MGNKANAKKRAPAASRSGTRKTLRTENLPPRQTQTEALTQYDRPKPRPLRQRKPSISETSHPPESSTSSDAEAAQALLAMRQVQAEAAEPSQSVNKHIFRPVLNLGRGSLDEGDEDEESSQEDELEEEDDELQDDIDDRDLELPTGTPRPSREEFAIPFEVPHHDGKATRDLDGITSRTTFAHFLTRLAERMETRVSLLTGIAYIPSYKPKSPKPVPKLLEDEESWEKLIADVSDYIEDSKAKSRGKGKVKGFTIKIYDTSGSDPDESSKKGKGRGKKGPEVSESALQLSGNSMAVSTAQDHQLLRMIEKAHYCNECKAACLLQDDGSHYKYTMSDLGKWVILLGKHKATIDTPPLEAMGLADKVLFNRQKSAKRALADSKHHDNARGSSGDSDAPPTWIQHLLPVVFGGINHSLRSYAPQPVMAPVQVLPLDAPAVHSAAATPISSAMPVISATADSEASATASKRKHSLDDDDSSPVLPLTPSEALDIWFAKLDADPVRGRMNLNYRQYLEPLARHAIVEVSDIIKLSPEKLVTLVNMPLGIANRLVDYAQEDSQIAKKARRA